MDVLTDLLNNTIAIDFNESDKEDVYELSDIIDMLYPGISDCEDFYYPTLESFYDEFYNNDVCFYNKDKKTWDGYGTYTAASNSGFSNLMTAQQILENTKRYKIKQINDNDIMKILND